MPSIPTFVARKKVKTKINEINDMLVQDVDKSLRTKTRATIVMVWLPMACNRSKVMSFIVFFLINIPLNINIFFIATNFQCLYEDFHLYVWFTNHMTQKQNNNIIFYRLKILILWNTYVFRQRKEWIMGVKDTDHSQ